MSRPDPWLLCDPYCAQFKCYHEEETEMNPTNIEPVTEVELARVLELDAKATRGPLTVNCGESITIRANDGLVATVTHLTLTKRREIREVEANAQLFAEYRTLTPRLARELAAARAAIKVAREAFSKLMRKLSTIEVLGEWEALDINPGLRKKTRPEVDAVVAEASAALAQLNTHTHEIENATLRKISHTHE